MKFLNPEEVLREFGVYGTQDVGDLGAGSGHFSLAAAKRLDGGRLFAVDIEKEMLSRLVAEATERGLGNVHSIWGDVSTHRGVPLAEASLDRAIVSNVLFQAHDRDAFAAEVKRLLKPGGKALVIDWTEESAFGPHRHHRLSEDAALSLFVRHGFEKERNVDAGDHHYGIILIR